MLTEDEKKHFKEEEVFRYEVRKSLEKKEKKPFWPRLWELMNSAFGLWLLSTVVVGLVASSYGDLKAKNEINAKNTETRRKLETEVSSRLQIFRASLLGFSTEQYFQFKYTQLATMVDGTSAQDKDRPLFVFPDFKDRTLQSLLFELEQLTADQEEAKVIKNARTVMTHVKNTLMTLSESPSLNNFQVQSSSKYKPTKQDTIKQLKNEHDQGIYNTKISGVFDRLGKEMNGNSFLKKASAG